MFKAAAESAVPSLSKYSIVFQSQLRGKICFSLGNRVVKLFDFRECIGSNHSVYEVDVMTGSNNKTKTQ